MLYIWRSILKSIEQNMALLLIFITSTILLISKSTGRTCIEKLTEGEGADFLSFFPGLLGKMNKKMDGEFKNDIHSMAEWCNVAVQIEPSRITFAEADTESVDYAKQEAIKILGFYFPQNTGRVDLEYDSVDYIAGEDDRNLMRLQQMGASVTLDRKGCYVWISALLPRNVDAVRKRVEDLQKTWGELFQVQLYEFNLSK